MSEILEKWSALKKSEQSMLTYGFFIISITVLYYYVWNPYNKSIENFEQKILYVQEDIAWLKGVSKQIQQLKSGTTRPVGSYSGSLINIIDKSIKQNKLDKNVSLLEKSGTNKVVIQFTKIPFDDLIKIMGYFKNRYGILVKNITIQRSENEKLVNSRVTLK